MKTWTRFVAGSLTFGLSFSTAALGQPTASDIANAQALATLNSSNITNSNAKTEEDLSVLKAVQGAASGGGSGGGGDMDKSAEALLVSHYSMVGAAEKLAASIPVEANKETLIVWGSVPPASVGDYFQFLHEAEVLDAQLVQAEGDWTAAQPPRKTPPKEKKPKAKLHDKHLAGGAPAQAGQAIVNTALGAAAASNPVGLAITAALTAASMARVDTSINGVAVAPDQERSREIVMAALQAHRPDLREYDLPSDPSEQALNIGFLKVTYDRVSERYRREYLPMLAGSDDKTHKMPAAAAAAGQELTAAVTATETFRKTLYAPAAGSPTADSLLGGKLLSEQRGNRRILFLRSMSTAATVRSNKGFFVGLTRSPLDFDAATTIDYLLLYPSMSPETRIGPTALTGSAVFFSGVVHLYKLDAFLHTCPIAAVEPRSRTIKPLPPSDTPRHAGDCIL